MEQSGIPPPPAVVAEAQVNVQDRVTTTDDASRGPIQPIPMSFPAVLRSSGINDKFAHLRAGNNPTAIVSATIVPRKSKRDEKDGKRWIRRRENGSFDNLCFSIDVDVLRPIIALR